MFSNTFKLHTKAHTAFRGRPTLKDFRVKVSKETVAVLRRWGKQGNLVISTKLKM